MPNAPKSDSILPATGGSTPPSLRIAIVLSCCLALTLPPVAGAAQRERPPCEYDESALRTSAVQMGDEGLAAPRLVEQTLPEYSDAAREAGIEGDVYVEAVVDADGRVREPCLIRGLPDNDTNEAAIEAVLQWRFEPGTRDGEPVAVIALFTVTFRVS